MDIIKLKKEVLAQMKMPYTDRDTSLIKDTIPHNWLEHLIADFAAETLVYNPAGLISMKKTMSGCSEETKAAVVILYNWKRGDFIVGSISKNPRLGPYTPLFMYAHKLHHDVPYEMWDKEDDFIDFALGKSLYEAWTVKKKFKAKLYPEQIRKYRTRALTTKTTGVVSKNTAYKFNRIRINDDNHINASFGRILLQTWIANVEIRLEGDMILDLDRWDDVPEPLDVLIKLEKESVKNTDLEVRDM